MARSIAVNPHLVTFLTKSQLTGLLVNEANLRLCHCHCDGNSVRFGEFEILRKLQTNFQTLTIIQLVSVFDNLTVACVTAPGATHAHNYAKLCSPINICDACADTARGIYRPYMLDITSAKRDVELYFGFLVYGLDLARSIFIFVFLPDVGTWLILMLHVSFVFEVQ